MNLKLAFFVFLLFSVGYPLLVWNLKYNPSLLMNNKYNNYGFSLNLKIREDIQVSVYRKYLFGFVTLPVYVGGVSLRTMNFFWEVSVFFCIILFIANLYKYYEEAS